MSTSARSMQPLQYRIRRLSPSDLNADAMHDLAELERVLSPGLTLPMTRSWLARILGSGMCTIFVAEETATRRFIGMSTFTISAQPHRGKAWLEDVATLPEFAGQGVGYNLTQAVILEAVKQDFVTKLDLTSSDTRESAHRVYRGLGWEDRASRLMRLVPGAVQPDLTRVNTAALADAFPEVFQRTA